MKAVRMKERGGRTNKTIKTSDPSFVQGTIRKPCWNIRVHPPAAWQGEHRQHHGDSNFPSRRHCAHGTTRRQKRRGAHGHCGWHAAPKAQHGGTGMAADLKSRPSCCRSLAYPGQHGGSRSYGNAGKKHNAQCCPECCPDIPRNPGRSQREAGSA